MLQTSFRKKSFALITAATIISLAGLQSCDQNVDSGTKSDGALPGAGIEVTPAYVVIEERFQTEIVNLGLEKLGYEIGEAKELEPATMHVDIANGGITFTPTHWKLLHNDFYENSGGDEKLERVGVIIENALQGYAIDKATADKYNIKTLDQLKDPEIATLFDTDGDGKADLTGCNPGWGCELAIEHHLDAYELKDTVEHNQGKYFAIMADTFTRFDQGEPVFYYTWTPLWVSGKLRPGQEVEWLEVPFTDLPEAQGGLTEADTTAEGKNLGFAVEQIMVVANQEFVDNNPAAARFMELVKIPLNDISVQNQKIQDGEDSVEDIRDHAEAWITENQETFDGWVAEALSAVQ